MDVLNVMKCCIYFFLMAVPLLSTAQTKPGKPLYEQHCLACHQADGSGVPQMNPPLQKTTYVNGDPSTLIGIVLNGLNEDIEVNGEVYNNVMPAFGGILNDRQVADILTYVRSSFKNSSGPIAALQVKKERAKKK
jgi:mono/diheme cytochrome c family protein